MSVEVIREGQWPHECDLPRATTVPPGTVVRCEDCRRRWRVIVVERAREGQVWRRRYLPVRRRRAES